MDKSVFTDKNKIPSGDDLRTTLGTTYEAWKRIREFVVSHSPAVTEEWMYPGEKYGWSFRMKDKKRAIVYLLPREGFFKVAMVFGPAATEQVLSGNFAEKLKDDLRSAKPYAEGRGIRIDVTDEKILEEIFGLIRIKDPGHKK